MKLIVFDTDGTLLDTLGDINSSINAALDYFKIPRLRVENTRSVVGHGLRCALKDASSLEGKGLSSSELDKGMEILLSYYSEHYCDYTKPYDGIIELLRDIKEKGIMIGVVSNKRQEILERLLTKVLPDVHFSFILGEEEGRPLKPDPEPLLEELKRLDINKSEVVYVGDSEVDHSEGNNAEIKTIIVNYGFRSKEDLKKSGILNTLDSVLELRKMLLDC